MTYNSTVSYDPGGRPQAEPVSAGAIFLLAVIGGAGAIISARILDGVRLAGRTVHWPE